MKPPSPSWTPGGTTAGRGRRLAAALAAAGVLGCADPASADLVRGVAYVAAGIIEVPRATLTGAVRQFPIGIVTGALSGTLRGLGYVTRGVLEIAGSAIPIAKNLAPLIPVFL